MNRESHRRIAESVRSTELTRQRNKRSGKRPWPRGGGVINTRSDGLVKTYTAPTWDNDENEITDEGTVEVWPFKSDGSIDRTADPVELEHRLPMKTADVPQGAYIVWDSQGIVVLTCNTYEGFS